MQWDSESWYSGQKRWTADRLFKSLLCAELLADKWNTGKTETRLWQNANGSLICLTWHVHETYF